MDKVQEKHKSKTYLNTQRVVCVNKNHKTIIDNMIGYFYKELEMDYFNLKEVKLSN